MTNAELIAKIKAEVERLKDENNNIRCDSNKSYCQGYGDAFVDLLPFLSNLESEKPVSDDLEEAAENIYKTPFGTRAEDFKAGAEWQKEQDEKEQADLFTIVALDAAQRAKEQMMKDIPKWHKVQRGSCFDKYTDFLLSAREGHFYCSSMEVPRDGYILLVDELERLPKEDKK